MRQWTDAAAAVLATQSYSPFGVPRTALGPAPWGFTGEWHDPGGLVYLRARWYNPAWGRFTQVDPLSGFLGAPATQHPYAYVYNNPLNLIDPSGLGPGDVLRDLFTLPTTLAEEYESTHCNLSMWEHLQDEDFWEVVVIYAGYALVPVLAADLVPLMFLPFNLTGAWGGVVVLAAVGGTAVGGWAALNVLTGEKWYQGVGLAGLQAMGTVWARAGSGFETQLELVDAVTTDEVVGTPLALPPGQAGEIKLLLPPGGLNPWEGTPVSFVLEEDVTLYRVYSGEARRVGPWLSLTPFGRSADAVRYLALPSENSAKFICEVTVPAGTRVQIGWVRAQLAWGADRVGGHLQVFLLMKEPPSAWFGPGVPLE